MRKQLVVSGKRLSVNKTEIIGGFCARRACNAIEEIKC